MSRRQERRVAWALTALTAVAGIAFAADLAPGWPVTAALMATVIVWLFVTGESWARKMFLALVAVSAVAVALGTLYPYETKLALARAGNWVFETLPVGWMIGIVILGGTAMILLGSALMLFNKARAWYAA